MINMLGLLGAWEASDRRDGLASDRLASESPVQVPRELCELKNLVQATGKLGGSNPAIFESILFLFNYRHCRRRRPSSYAFIYSGARVQGVH